MSMCQHWSYVSAASTGEEYLDCNLDTRQATQKHHAVSALPKLNGIPRIINHNLRLCNNQDHL